LFSNSNYFENGVKEIKKQLDNYKTELTKIEIPKLELA
jgi:hypothetical protein